MAEGVETGSLGTRASCPRRLNTPSWRAGGPQGASFHTLSPEHDSNFYRLNNWNFVFENLEWFRRLAFLTWSSWGWVPSPWA